MSQTSSRSRAVNETASIDKVDVFEKTELLRPDGFGPTSMPASVERRRLSATGGTASIQAGNRKRSATSISSLSVGHVTGHGWKLKYQDFLPDKKVSFSNSGDWETEESFSCLVSRASRWLSKNPDVRVKSCQTITWMSHATSNLRGNCGELMVMSKSIADNATTYHIRGLRLWLVPASASITPEAQQQSTLSCIDFTPDRTKTNTIQGLVTLINGDIDEQQIKGNVLMVETVTVPIIDGVLDCGVTCWKENVSDDSQYAYILRVYCSSTARTTYHQNHRIGIKDVIPRPTEDGYEAFEDLTDRANAWFREQAGYGVVNLQSIMVLKDPGVPQSETGMACYFTLPGTANERPVEYFRILRLVFVRPARHTANVTKSLDVVSCFKTPDGFASGGDTPTPAERRRSNSIARVDAAPGSHSASATPCFTYETFTPEPVRNYASSSGHDLLSDRIETMNETFSKVMAFLQNSGSDVICAEVVFNPIQLYIEPADCVAVLPDEISFLYTIRVFLSRSQRRHNGSVRSTRRASNLSVQRAITEHSTSSGIGRNGSASVVNGDSQHPGPIFLGHVTSGRFKYRWLIIALSAISCMAVIVAVSVIYSNR